MVIIGEKIKAARLKRGLSQEELARALGVTKSTISKYELGHREPSMETFHQIATVLNVPFSDFLGPYEFPPYEFPPIDFRSFVLAPGDFGFSGNQQLPVDAQQVVDFMARMNAEGRARVVGYAEDLAQMPKYQRELLQTTPQSTPAPQEEQSTTPPPDAPETPPEGE